MWEYVKSKRKDICLIFTYFTIDNYYDNYNIRYHFSEVDLKTKQLADFVYQP